MKAEQTDGEMGLEAVTGSHMRKVGGGCTQVVALRTKIAGEMKELVKWGCLWHLQVPMGEVGI